MKRTSASGRRWTFTTTVLPMILALVFAACGGGGAGTGDETEGGDTGQETSAEGADDQEGGTIPVGLIVAITGSGSFYGEVMPNGAQLAAERIREEGGIEGYEFEILVEDHESGDADVAVTAARKLMNIENVPVILSSFTAPTVAVQSLAAEQGVLVMNGGGIGSDLVGKEGLYNTRMLGAQLMPGLVRWAVEQHDAQRVATLFWNDAAGRAINQTVIDVCSEGDCEVVAEEPHEVGATNYSSQLARIRSANPDLVALGSYGADVGHIIAQARRQGIEVPIIGNEWTPDAQEVGGEAMEGYVAVLDQFNPEADEDASEFADAYQASYDEAPEFYGANYYELVWFVLADLVRLAVENGEDPSEPGVLLQTMEQAAADNHEFETAYGESMTFNEDGTVQKPAGVYEIQDGELQQIADLVEGEVAER